MKVVVAKNAGFCWGVRRAMDCALEASTRWDARSPLRTLGPLIHNPQALEQLAFRGITEVGAVEAVQGGTLILRAHGIPLDDLRTLKGLRHQGRLRLVNAVCPEVARVQAQIRKASARGQFAIILGQREHAECIAHQSFAGAGCAVVASLAEARQIGDEQLRNAVVVAQTTFSAQDFQEITHYLKDRNPRCEIRNTICADTWARQDLCRELADQVQALVVVGGRASNNTRHLAEVGRQRGIPVFQVETAADLDLKALGGLAVIGVAAGASTPNWLVDEVVDTLEQSGALPGLAVRLWRAACISQAPMALAAGTLALGLGHWMGLALSWPSAIGVAAFIWATQALTPFLDPLVLMAKGPAQRKALLRNRTGLLGTGLVALLLAVGLAVSQGALPLLALAALATLRLLYSRPVQVLDHTRCLRGIPGSLDLGETLALVVLVVLVPLSTVSHPGGHRPWTGMLLAAALGLSRVVIQHLLDFQADQIQSREVLPRLLGRTWAMRLLVVVSALALGFGLISIRAGQDHHPMATALVLAAALSAPILVFARGQARSRASASWTVLGTSLGLFLIGLLALV